MLNQRPFFFFCINCFEVSDWNITFRYKTKRKIWMTSLMVVELKIWLMSNICVTTALFHAWVECEASM